MKMNVKNLKPNLDPEKESPRLRVLTGINAFGENERLGVIHTRADFGIISLVTGESKQVHGRGVDPEA
ncbi:hypothetical protein D3C87_1816430 [compost metagenome]